MHVYSMGYVTAVLENKATVSYFEYAAAQRTSGSAAVSCINMKKLPPVRRYLIAYKHY
jgi:hypothetical protein